MSVSGVKKTFGTGGQNYGRRNPNGNYYKKRQGNQSGKDADTRDQQSGYSGSGNSYGGKSFGQNVRQKRTIQWEMKDGGMRPDFDKLLNERRVAYTKNVRSFQAKSEADAESARQKMETGRREFVLGVLQSAQQYMSRDGSGFGSLVHLGTSFLILHKCGGIRNNLNTLFNQELDKADALNPAFAEKCARTKASDRMPYDPSTAALDRTAMDLSYYERMHDPDIPASDKASIQRVYEQGRVSFDGMCREDGVDKAEYLKERQKVVAGLIFDDPSRCRAFGIEIGDDTWNRMVKQCGAVVEMDPPSPKNIGEAKVKVSSFKIPPEGFTADDGSAWQEDKFLRKREPQPLSDHKEALRSFLDKDSFEDIRLARAGSNNPERNARGLSLMARMHSRMQMMRDDGISEQSVKDMMQDLFHEVSGEKETGYGKSRDFHSGFTASDEVQRQAEEMSGSGPDMDMQYG